MKLCGSILLQGTAHNPLLLQSKERFGGDAELPSSNDIIIMSSHCTTVNNFLLIYTINGRRPEAGGCVNHLSTIHQAVCSHTPSCT